MLPSLTEQLETLNGKTLAHMRADSLCRLMAALRAATERCEEELARRRPERYAQTIGKSIGAIVIAAGIALATVPVLASDAYERCSEFAEYTNPLEKREWERCLKAGGPELAPEAYMLLAVKPGTNKPVTLGPFTKDECQRMMLGLKREASLNSLCRRRSDGRPF